MEIDLSQTDRAQLSPAILRAQVCIIGAGIAGLTLAHKLVEQGIDILLLEAGGHTPDADLPVDLLGQPYAAATHDRVHAFGGSSLLWGGQLLPPAQAGNLTPHLAAAERLLGVNTLPYAAPEFFANIRRRPPALLCSVAGLKPRLSKFAPFAERNLAATLGRVLRTHPRVKLILHAPVTELLLLPSRDRIEAALVRTPDGRVLRIEATHFVVAAGTLESVRLLLASRSVAPEGIGNTHGQLGRNLHDHLTLTAATLTGPARARLLRELRPWVFGRTLHSLKLEASAQLRTELGLNPVMAHLTIEEPAGSGIALLRNTLRARQGGEASPRLRPSPYGLPRTAREAFCLALAARLQHRRYVSPAAVVRLQLNAAQATPSLSRITLSDRCDTFGRPLPAIDWHVLEPDLSTFSRFTRHLRTGLDSVGLSSSNGVAWHGGLFGPDAHTLLARDLDDARHPMGGAIMSAGPRTGVVDADLSIHGIANLSLASAATFPDGSAQLPTLPLMALTLRLADRLRGQLPG